MTLSFPPRRSSDLPTRTATASTSCCPPLSADRGAPRVVRHQRINQTSSAGNESRPAPNLLVSPVIFVRRLAAGSRADAGSPLPGSTISTPTAEPSTDSQPASRSEEHTSELQSLMRISYAVFCLQKKNKQQHNTKHTKR